jgi:outer membrane biosynthesis protein TonB
MKRFFIITGLTVVFVGALLLTLFVRTSTANADIAAGNQAYSAKNYDTALQHYTAAQSQAPSEVEPAYNAANTYYRQNVLDKAQQTLEQTLAQPHNAKYNLELALQQKQQQDQQQQQNKDQQKQQDQQQNQDQQNKPSDQQNQSDGQPDQQQQKQQDQQQSQQSDQKNQQQGQQGNQQDQQQGQQAGQPDQQRPDQKDGQAAGALPQKGLTPEQARRLLAVIGGNSKTLMEQLQQTFIVPGDNPDKDW